MSTEQKIIMKQIDSSDTIKDFMEKCNENFSIISEFGGGPTGKEGSQGSQGVPTKPKVPIHVWKKGEQYENESFDEISEKFKLNLLKEDELKNTKYQEGHLIVIENANVYILEVVDNKLTPNYILTLQSFDPNSVVDGKSSYVHIAFANFDENGKISDFILSENLIFEDSIVRKYMGIYSDYNESSYTEDNLYTWVKIVGEKGDKGDAPTPKSVKAIGYSLTDLDLNSSEWKNSIQELGTLKPGSNVYIKNEYTWSNGSSNEIKTYGKIVTITGTQGVKGDKGDTGRVLFYLGSFKDGTLTGNEVSGYLNEYRCDYYIDINDVAWMRTGTSEKAKGYRDGRNDNTNWKISEKIGFLQDGAISADMINNSSFSKKTFDAVNAKEINAEKISSKDGKSWFDLNKSEFSFGKLLYNGEELHTGGTLNIGGQNLLENTSFHYEYKANQTVGFTTIYTISNKDIGKKFIATYGKFDDKSPNGVGNEWTKGVCLVLSESPYTDTIEEVFKFGEPFVINENKTNYIGNRFLYIAWGDYDYLKSIKGNMSPDEMVSKDFTQSLDQVMLQEGEAATNFQPSISAINKEIDTYEYLKEALENDDDGGIVATSQIQLKNSDNTVNAGLSSKKDDNILLWGGGTYEEAVNAASKNNDYHVEENKGGKQITSLLKKDGQGKIGIFKISDTQAIVNTNEGELHIDVNADGGGIFIRNSGGENKISIKNSNLGENIISRKRLGSKTYTYNDIICSGDSIQCTSKRDTYLWSKMFRTYSGGTNKITVSFKNVSFKQTFHNLDGYASIKNTKAIIGLYYTELGSLTPILACSPQELTLYHSELSGNNHVAETTNIGFFQFTHTATKGGYEYYLYVNLIGEDKKACLDDFMMQGTVDWSLDFEPNGQIIPRTIIGTDGFAIINDKDKYFMVKNTTKNGQQIFVNGLPNKSEGLEPGMLYNDNGTLKIVQ